MDADRYLIVLPTYDERDNLPRMVASIDAIRDQLPMPGDVLVVDDGSPDGTGDVADELAAHHEWLSVLHRTEKRGLGRAYLAGFAWALERPYTHVIEMDCDLSHPVDALPAILAASADADLVLGSRYTAGGGVEGWPVSRKLISRGGCAYARLVLGVDIRDLTGGFKCFRRWVLESLDLRDVRAGGYAFQIELTYRTLRMGGRVVEVPITFVDRAHGESKMSRAIVLEAVRQVPALRIRAVRGRLIEGSGGRPLPVADTLTGSDA
ncbi:MAG TPA: polyprenol monophosphomannose synthase [Gaiellales bacterium]|jgi:dolichol-phosphate mannosyltransferase